VSVHQFLARLLRHRDDLSEAVHTDVAAGDAPRKYAVAAGGWTCYATVAAAAQCSGVRDLYGPAVADADARLPTAGQVVRELHRAFWRVVDDAPAAVAARVPLSSRPAWLEFLNLTIELETLLPHVTATPPAGAGPPGQPRADYCLVPPSTIRWRGEREVAPRVYHLLAHVLAVPLADDAIHFDALKKALGNDHLGDKSLRNYISELSAEAAAVSFPWYFTTKGCHLLIDRGG
jgi:hypothetical protein